MSHVFHRMPHNTYPVAVRGDGAYLIDSEGKRYLDASGGAAVSCLGHSDRSVIDAIKAQLDRLPFAHTSFFSNEPMEELADELIAIVDRADIPQSLIEFELTEATVMGDKEHTVELLNRLRSHGYDYWALGHIHSFEILSRDPYVVFPGNLQGRHIGETGPKGACIVSVQDGQVSAVEHHPLDVLRWANLTIDLSAATDEADALARTQTAMDAALQAVAPLPLALRLSLIGATAAHTALASSGLREKILHEAHALPDGARLWLEAVRLQTRPAADLASLRQRADHLGQLLAEIDALVATPEPDLLGDWPATMWGKLRDGLPDPHALQAASTGDIADLLQRARATLEAALAEQG